MISNTSKAGLLGLGAALAIILSTSGAGAWDPRDIASQRPEATSSTPVSQSHMPVCAWRHCQITP